MVDDNLNRNKIMNLKQIEELALELIEQDTLDLNDERITLKDDFHGATVAHYMASYGYKFPKGSKLLTLTDNCGTTVAYLMSIADVEVKGQSDSKRWVCKCSCGNEVIVEESLLINGTVTHCGCQFDKGKVSV